MDLKVHWEEKRIILNTIFEISENASYRHKMSVKVLKYVDNWHFREICKLKLIGYAISYFFNMSFLRNYVSK